jgi:uncharacterized membrane protein YjdF
MPPQQTVDKHTCNRPLTTKEIVLNIESLTLLLIYMFTALSSLNNSHLVLHNYELRPKNMSLPNVFSLQIKWSRVFKQHFAIHFIRETLLSDCAVVC